MSGGLIVLTGATAGIGRALAHAFAEHGCTVLGAGRNAAALAELPAALPAPHHFSAVDVAQPEQVERWAKHILSAHGPPELLINCAGVMNRLAPLWQLSVGEVSRVIDINLAGTIHTIRAFVPAMIARGRGMIVNFSSGWGHAAAAQVALYCATKWAIEGLTRALALELPAGLGAVTLNPGVVDTAMLRACLPEELAPSPREWAVAAAPRILALGPQDNGRSLTLTD